MKETVTSEEAAARSERADAAGEVESLRTEMNSYPDWFHNIDLGNGLVTPGRGYESLWRMNRQLMDGVDFRGKSVLEVGAYDGMFSFEAERRGAAYVAAIDRVPHALERFNFCKRVLRSNVVPFYDTSVYELAGSLPRLLSGLPPGYAGATGKFDVVICFGVLYHLKDPMAGLAHIRSVVKDDGVVLFETACLRSRRPLMYFNTDGKLFYPDPGTWWAPSLACLKAMCRGSLLEVVPGSIPWRFRLSGIGRKVGRIGFLAKPVPPERLQPAYLSAIQTHYPTPLPRL
jgi:tRNA (mo5U34)-methyltransferase